MHDVALHPRQTSTRTEPERLFAVDPLHQGTWEALLDTHAESSFFHGTAWARVLHETYGHQPVYFCRVASGRLEQLLPIMQVSSPLTGRRGVSLPFTDYCQPLRTNAGNRGALYELALQEGRQRGWKYLECRGGPGGWEGASPSLAFYGHVLALQRGPQALFESFDGATRRGIRKAEREGLHVEFGDSLDSIRDYYALHCRTRRRHGLPPQPFRFFRNIARFVLAPGQGFVATAWLAQRPLASAVFFHRGAEVICKFGASDHAFQHLRPTNLVMWESIKRCLANGFGSLHLGRTSLLNEGLRRFKLGFGAQEQRIEYCKFDFAAGAFVTDVDRAQTRFNCLFRRLPLPLLRLAGAMLYPHVS